MRLPFFRFHPAPVASGAVVASDGPCECCGQARGYRLGGPVYTTADVTEVCPWCLADGSAAAKWDAEFVDGQFVNSQGDTVQLSDDLYDEVFRRTPGVCTFQPVAWWVHCGSPAAFMRLDGDDVMFRCVMCSEEHCYRDLD